MQELQSLAESFFTSAGYHFLQQRDGFFVADRLGLGGLRDTWLVWVPRRLNLPEDYRRSESGLLGEFRTYIPKYPKARYFVLTPSVSFTKPFQVEASRLAVTLTVPIFFFDSPYRHELAADYKSAISSLVEVDGVRVRVPQPFLRSADGTHGDDLFSELVEDISTDRNPFLRIVVGPAGIGKSVLFGALFNALYQRFQKNKQKRQVSPRPVPLLPTYLRRTTSVRTAQVIEEFLRTDVASPVLPATFEWMLCNGYSTWLFDGLDELYTGDPDFFVNLLDLFTRPSSEARVLLCARESLITTSPSFADFLEEFSSSSRSAVKIYRLENWQRKSKRIFAWVQFEGCAPKSQDRDPEKVDAFLRLVESSDSFKALSGVPYYCSLVLEDFKRGTAQEFGSDFALIEHAVDSMVEREKSKGLISMDMFQTDGLAEWLDEVAFHHYLNGFAGLSADEIAVFAKLVLVEDLSREQQESATTSLIQFPLFKRGTEIGTVSFEHELICEYLAARFIIRRITSDPEWAGRSLSGRTDLSGSLMLRYLAANLPMQREALAAIGGALRHGTLMGHAYASLLQVLLLAYPDRDLLKSQALEPEGRDLSHVQFEDRDLTDISFRNCNLSGTTFSNCSLQSAHFEGAYLIGTTFLALGDLALEGAHFGNLERFSFIRFDDWKIEDLAEAAEWVKTVTRVPTVSKQPCPAAQQLRILFMKFIALDGTSKRDEHQEKDLLTGKRVKGAPAQQDLVEASLRFGYIRQADRPGRLRRASGDRYGDMVQFVSSLKLSDDLRQLLNSICDKTSCEHAPSALRAGG